MTDANLPDADAAEDITYPELEIEKLVHGGFGLGRLPEGKYALVAGALPGERVSFQKLKERRKYMEARTVEVLRAAPERITPPCAHCGPCGGCDLQHAAYEAQLAMKAAIVRENLERGGVEVPDGVLAPPLPSPQQFGYRYRLCLHVGRDGQPGFFQRRTNQVAPVTRCPVATDGINAVLAKIAINPLLRTFLKRTAKEVELVQCPKRGRITMLVHAKKPFVAELRDQAAALFAQTLVVDCLLVGQSMAVYRRGGCDPEPRQTFRLGGEKGPEYTLTWPAGGFVQANCRQNENLVAMVREAVAAVRPKTVLDLFCGTGNFSIPPALSGAVVLGVENNRLAVQWAQRNADAAGLPNCRFLCGNAAIEPKRLLDQGERYDAIILDPPRQGLGRAAALLPQLGAKRIVSVSCDPATHARDLKLMLDAGCRLLSITPVDMFPQTHHIEMVAVLEGAGA